MASPRVSRIAPSLRSKTAAPASGSLALAQRRCGAKRSPSAVLSQSYSSSSSSSRYAPAFRIPTDRTFSRFRPSARSSIPIPRTLATSSRAQSQAEVKTQSEAPLDDDGPSARYSALVSKNILSDDPHQRHIISYLQTLHNKIKTYEQNPPPPPRQSSIAAAAGKAIGVDAVAKSAMPTFGGIFGRLFGRGGAQKEEEEEHSLKIGENIPKGMYLYGDVGTGKS